jgi:glutaminase
MSSPPDASPQQQANRSHQLMGRSLSSHSIASTIGGEEEPPDSVLAALFVTAQVPGEQFASCRAVLSMLQRRGLQATDPRIKHTVAFLSRNDTIEQAEFIQLVGENHLIERALTGSLAIEDFAGFSDDVTKIYKETESNRSGAPADYIPQLARVNPNQFGVGVCTVDGQRYSVGDVTVPFCVQSTTKPLA